MAYYRSRGNARGEHMLLASYYNNERTDNPFLEFERAVARLAYPATLPTKVKRLFAKQLANMHERYTKERYKLSNEPIDTTEKLALNDLTPAHQKLYKDYVRAKKAYDKARTELQTIRTKLNTEGYDIYAFEDYSTSAKGAQDVRVARKLTQPEIDAKTAAKQASLNAHFAQGVSDATAFEQMLKDYATEQIIKTTLKLPESFREIMNQLSKHKALPAPQAATESPAAPEPTPDAVIDLDAHREDATKLTRTIKTTRKKR